jgi:hypothetical protein
MHFTFSGMVRDNPVIIPDTMAPRIDIGDEKGKHYLSIERHGEITHNAQLIDCLCSRYVAFSGKAFPHILVPLMAAEGVMINPARPLVIYQSMEINLNRLDLKDLMLDPLESSMNVEGKRGMVRLDFRFTKDGTEVGTGAKFMALRGLRPYESDTMQHVITDYNNYKQSYSAN